MNQTTTRKRGRPSTPIVYDVQKIIDDYKNGKTQKAISKDWGVSPARIHKILKKHNLTAKFIPKDKVERAQTVPTNFGPKYTEYNLPKLISDFKRGKTMVKIAKEYGVSRERIRQILLKHNISGSDGGASVRGMLSRQSKEMRKHFTLLEKATKYGFPTIKEYLEHVETYGSRSNIHAPLHKFAHHRINVMKHHSIEWKLSFYDWWEVWKGSNRWNDRAAGGYGMKLIDPTKPYQKGNVEIYLISGGERPSTYSPIRKPKTVKNEGPTLWDDYQLELKNMQ